MTSASTTRSWTISAGSVVAVVNEVGGSLMSLTLGGRDLVVPWDHRVMPLHRGAVLAPWPNRVADGRYAFAGTDNQLALTEPDRHNAIHGLADRLAWDGEQVDASTLELSARVVPQKGYPHLLDLVVRYAVDDTGLTWTLTAVNSGDEAAPYGCSVHPYLHAGTGRVDDWTLTLPATRRLEVDDHRLLPTGLVDVGGDVPDFRDGLALSGVVLDHAYTGLGGGEVSATVVDAEGVGARIRWDADALPWVQVHTADRPEPGDNRVGMALEPMTCPPNALATGQDVVALARAPSTPRSGASRPSRRRGAPAHRFIDVL